MTSSIRYAVFCLSCVISVLLGINVGDALAADITIAPGQSCTSAGCHEQFGTGKHVHPAMEDGDCSSCHEQDGDAHAFELPAKGNELCFMCHEHYEAKKNRHAALEDGCTTCHNPHQSATKDLLEADSLADLCFTCHDDSIVKRKWSHGPAEAGECTICHNPHESDSAKLLAAAPPGLCYTCHSEVEDALGKQKVVHAAVEDGCTNCHDPHGQDYRFFLSAEVPQLCFTCHGDVEKTVSTATVKHGILEKDKRCLNCHLPHTSDHGSLLIVSSSELCYTCHNKAIKTPDGPLKDMKKLVKEHEYPHGPVADNDCVSCHEPHGSKYFRILNERYPGGFYAGFSEDAYALCFTCHENKPFIYERTVKATDFRDGSRNLHYLHVNKPSKGRVCTVCHEVHASHDPQHIGETTLFGKWEMPIRFERTETGGNCYPGCHKFQAYDREAPVMQE